MLELNYINAALSTFALTYKRLSLAQPTRYLVLCQAGVPTSAAEVLKEYSVLLGKD
jgi:hypothetical protein